jgi:hypothetical protein
MRRHYVVCVVPLLRAARVTDALVNDPSCEAVHDAMARLTGICHHIKIETMQPCKAPNKKTQSSIDSAAGVTWD